MSTLYLPIGDERLGCFAPQALARGTAGGARVQRFPAGTEALLGGAIGPLANLRSASGCALLLRCDAPWLELDIKRLRHHQHAGVGIDLEICHDDGATTYVHSADLRDRDGDMFLRLCTGLERGGPLATVWIHLPLISTLAIAGISLPEGSQVRAAHPPQADWLALGDSLTQGFSVAAPTQHWLFRVTRAQGHQAWNLGLGGLLIQPELYTWALARGSWRVISIGLGSNHAWHASTVGTVRARAKELLQLVDHYRGGARVLWLAPPWKACEGGKGPPDFAGVPLDAAAAARLHQVRAELEAVWEQYPWLEVVRDPLPHDARLLSDGLHPTALGMRHYAQAVSEHLTGESPGLR